MYYLSYIKMYLSFFYRYKMFIESPFLLLQKYSKKRCITNIQCRKFFHIFQFPPPLIEKTDVMGFFLMIK